MSVSPRIECQETLTYEVKEGGDFALFVLAAKQRVLIVDSPLLTGSVNIHVEGEDLPGRLAAVSFEELMGAFGGEPKELDIDATISHYEDLVAEAEQDPNPMWGLSADEARAARALLACWRDKGFRTAEEFIEQGWQCAARWLFSLNEMDGLDLNGDNIDRIEEVLTQSPHVERRFPDEGREFFRRFWTPFVAHLARENRRDNTHLRVVS
jgi:hypothetical protein